MHYLKAERFIMALLQADLPPSMYYHDYKHTMDVVKASVELAIEEKISDKDDLNLLKTAALFHDCGFVHAYSDHEDESCRIAKEVLPGFGYNKKQIGIICKMIMKTKYATKPQTHLEKILCDADLDYLGRDDFASIGKKLYREWKTIGKVKTPKEWYKMQVEFLESHQYHTQSAILKREKKKRAHLDQLKNQKH